jgi:peptide-methionine (S)-S-oxide reductase
MTSDNAGQKNTLAIATFGAGCFWGIEEVYRVVPGVVHTSVGFMGGDTPVGGEHPTYEQVSRGNTAHAEVVQLQYDPKKVSYSELLTLFWENHDPTQLNRQGPDVGSQYRSVIFYHTPEQEKFAKESKVALEQSGKYKQSIVTDIVPAPSFYKAEEYHQRYLEKRGLKSCPA